MATIIDSLFLELGIDVSKFSKDQQRALEKIKQFESQTKRAADKASTHVKKVGEAFRDITDDTSVGRSARRLDTMAVKLKSLGQASRVSGGVTEFDNLLWMGERGGDAPFNYVILAQPANAGASFDAASWQIGWSNQDAYHAGYGRLRIRPTGTITNGVFGIRAYGQSGNYIDHWWTASTIAGYYFDSTTPANSHGFVFLDPVNGVDPSAYPSVTGTTNNVGSPIKTLSNAFGSTAGLQTYPNAIITMRVGTVPTFAQDPVYGIGIGANGLRPAAMMAFPEEFVVVDFSVSGSSMGFQASGAELFLQGFACISGNSSAINFKHFQFSGPQLHLVVDGVSFPDAIHMTNATDNAGPLEFAAQNITYHTYTFINGVGETNLINGGLNQFLVHDLYTTQYALTQFCSILNSNRSMNWKDAVADVTAQYCDIVNASGWSYMYLGGFAETVGPADSNYEYRYCNFISGGTVSGQYAAVLNQDNGTVSNVYMYRCTLNGDIQIGANTGGPVVLDDLVIQYNNSGNLFDILGGAGLVGLSGLPSFVTYGTTDPSGTGEECLGQTGIINADGTLTSAYAAYVGRRGAQIA